jgi:hypothetical protein
MSKTVFLKHAHIGIVKIKFWQVPLFHTNNFGKKYDIQKTRKFGNLF